MFQRCKADRSGWQAVIPRPAGWEASQFAVRADAGRSSLHGGTRVGRSALLPRPNQGHLPETMSWRRAIKSAVGIARRVLGRQRLRSSRARWQDYGVAPQAGIAAAMRTTLRLVNLRFRAVRAWIGLRSGADQVVEALTRRLRRPAARAAERARRAGGSTRWSAAALLSARPPAPILAIGARG
jgi:hypothetical protein